MSCELLHVHLDAYLAGELAPDLRERLRTHLEDCAECRTVVEVVGGAEASSMVLDVVARTTGSNCARIREALGASQDEGESLRPEVRAHLDDCPGCAEIDRALRWMRPRLARLAEVEVDADFTADVLMATLPRPHLWEVFRMRVVARFEQWLDRPAFAQEFAFAFTVLLVLLTATPWSPLPQLPQRALQWVQFVPAAQAGEPDTTEESWSLVQALPPLRYAAAATDGLRGAVGARADRMARDLEWVGAGIGETGQGVLAGEGTTVRDGIHVLGCGLESLWVGLKRPEAPVEVDCADAVPVDGTNGRTKP